MASLKTDKLIAEIINVYKSEEGISGKKAVQVGLLFSNQVVRNPNNPVFYGYRSSGGGWESYPSPGSVYVYNVEVTNIGNCYNTSTGVFTCPIDGMYAVAPGVLAGNNGNTCTLQVYKNDINVTARGVHSNTVGTNNWRHNSTVFLIKCFKNDTLKIWITTGAATAYGNDGYSHCSIWLY